MLRKELEFDMGAKECVYLVIVGLASVLFYLRGYHRAEAKARAARRKLQVPYNDSGCLTELPADDFESVMRELEGVRVKSISEVTQADIRAVFGDN